MTTTTDTLKALTPYALADLAGVAAPDSPTSAGAGWLDTIRVDVIDMLHDDEISDDSIHEHADSAVSVYKHERMTIVVDLAIWDEDIEEYAGDSGEVTILGLAGLAQYVVAERLIRALIESAGLDDESGE